MSSLPPCPSLSFGPTVNIDASLPHVIKLRPRRGPALPVSTHAGVWLVVAGEDGLAGAAPVGRALTQREAFDPVVVTALGVTCFTLRESTAHHTTLKHETNVLLGDDPSCIASKCPSPW